MQIFLHYRNSLLFVTAHFHTSDTTMKTNMGVHTVVSYFKFETLAHMKKTDWTKFRNKSAETSLILGTHGSNIDLWKQWLTATPMAYCTCESASMMNATNLRLRIDRFLNYLDVLLIGCFDCRPRLKKYMPALWSVLWHFSHQIERHLQNCNIIIFLHWFIFPLTYLDMCLGPLASRSDGNRRKKSWNKTHMS